MKNNNNLMFFLVGVTMLCGLFMEGVQGRSKPGVVGTGKAYTVQQLLNLINSNNPGNNSDFIVAVDGHGNVITGNGSITTMTQSKSAAYAGLDQIIQENLNTTVTLHPDPTLITFLMHQGSLNASMQAQYSKICLYFTLSSNGPRFYLNDPNPGHIVTMAGVTRSPAQEIINKWSFNPAP